MATLDFKFIANLAGLQSGVKTAEGNLTGFQKTTEGISKKLGAALGAVSFITVIKGLTDMAKNAEEDRIQSELLANQIRNTTSATEDQVKAVSDYIDKTSKQYGIVDDKLRPAMSRLVTVTGDTSKATELMNLAMDISAATGKPLEGVATALGKAYNGQFTSLNKLGIPMLESVQNSKDLTAAQKGLEKAQFDYNYQVETYGAKSKQAQTALGKVAEAQTKVNTITAAGIDWQKDLGDAFKGAAEKAINPMERLTIVFDEAKETIGAAFLPVIIKLSNALIPIVDKLAPTFAKLIDGLAPIVIDLVDALMPLIEAILPPLLELFIALMPVVKPIIDLLTILLVPIIKVLAFVLGGLVKLFLPLINGFADMGKGITNAFTGIGSWFKKTINMWIGIFESFTNGVIDGINLIPNALNSLKFKVPDWVPFIGGKTLGFKIPTFGHIKIPRLAKGGVVMPSPGGSIVNVAEAGRPEAIVPLDRLGSLGGGNTYVININRASLTGDEVIRAIRRFEISQGRVILNG
jgi:hypothetical protein